MTTIAALTQEIAKARRHVELAEARLYGLHRASVADTSVLFYTRDVQLQWEFEA